MNEEPRVTRGSEKFTDLSSFESIRVQRNRQTGNVIKGSHVVSIGTHAIELHEGADDHPSVVVHRHGDRVDRIEFDCPCGRGSSIRLEYDDD